MNSYGNCQRIYLSGVLALTLVLGGSRASAQIKKPSPPVKATPPAKPSSAVTKATPPGKPPVNPQTHVEPSKPNVSTKGPIETRPKVDVISRGSKGGPKEVKLADRGMVVHHGLEGQRRVVVERRDGSRVVAEHGRRGYIEHPYRYGGRDFGRRTYYHDGRIYDHYYARAEYHGIHLNYYTPSYYYRPTFYGWAYNRWATPTPYVWGWVGNPWYQYYGSYFTPYPVYPNASVWLTDYLISASLAAAYETQVQAAQAQGSPPPEAAALTPDVKDLISAEVQRQIALENSEAAQAQTAVPDPLSSSVERMLADQIHHVFLVGNALDLTNAAGAECAVSQGDALQLAGPPPANSPTANLVVLASKGGVECRKGDIVSVQIADLQDMQNQMRETIDAGLGELQKPGSQLPQPPLVAQGTPVKASFMTDAPAPDATVATEITQQWNDSVQAENKALGVQDPPVQPAQPQAAPPKPAPAQISLGQSIEQLMAALGQPTSVFDRGSKKVYVYRELNMKVTFKDEKVAAFQ